MSGTITIKEYESWRFGSKLTDADIQDLKRAESSAFTVSHDSLKVHKYVGCFATKSGTVIEVLPKFNLSETNEETRSLLLPMLRHWRHKGFQELSNGQIRAISRFPMLDAFIYLFLNKVRDIARIGLSRKYVEIEENLTHLRGRILFRENLRENIMNQAIFYILHDELSENRLVNHLIQSALQMLRGNLNNVADPQLLNEITAAFHEVPISKNVHADWDAHCLDRTMSLYRPVMQWIRLFLFHEGFATYSGPHENVSLLFPM